MMNIKQAPSSIFIFTLLLCGGFFLTFYDLSPKADLNDPARAKEKKDRKEKKRLHRSLFARERLLYEFNMLKDPATGKIPQNIRKQEMELARTIPLKEQGTSSFLRTTNLNTYQPAGPDNIGGRTRAVAFDIRYGTGNNRVIISGSVSGGIYRSGDGGNNWTRVTPEGELHNLTALAQDTRTGFENTWYAGGGEALGNSANGIDAFYLGQAILKSVDNGITWTRLTLAVTNSDGSPISSGNLESLDHPFDLVHKIVVNPVNGHVYICGHRRLVRSTNGGSSFSVIFTGTAAANSDAGQMDIVATNGGRLYLAVNGGNPNLNLRGVWTSATGDFNTWVRFAGGQSTGTDSITGWRGNSYNQTQGVYNSKRILLALAPSNQNILYAMYENGLSQQAGRGANPEADLFRFTFVSGSQPSSISNLSTNMPDFPGQVNGIDPLALQNGYNMMVAVKPDNPNIVFIGGTNLYRSTDGFNSSANTEWIGGYNKSNPPSSDFYTNSHADIHNLVFQPSNPNVALCANDGGLQFTSDITAARVNWTMAPNYQTLQYYYVSINPAPGRFSFLGGAQDNGSLLRPEGSNSHAGLNNGDGGAVGFGTGPIYYHSYQQGGIYRNNNNQFSEIRPNGTTSNPNGGFGDFITYFKTDFDNPEDLYYVNFNRVFRTRNASTVSGSGWEELSGVSSAVNPANVQGTNVSIRALELSRGAYIPSHVMYIGSNNGKVFRLDNPRNAPAGAAPVNITPPGLTGNVSDIAVNPNNDAEIMVTVSNYGSTGIWWTSNAKSSLPAWKNVEGNLSLPSIRSCMIVTRKDASNKSVTEYYAGTSVGLYSIIDIRANTVNWVREGANVLNYAVVTSLDYRPQDNTLLVGTHGNGMFYANAGTPDFTPDINTGINDPVVNDKNFIVSALPTITNRLIQYTTGNMADIPRMTVRLHNVHGQLIFSREAGYESGTIDVSGYAKGLYVLTIVSNDNKQKFIQRLVKY